MHTPPKHPPTPLPAAAVSEAYKRDTHSSKDTGYGMSSNALQLYMLAFRKHRELFII